MPDNTMKQQRWQPIVWPMLAVTWVLSGCAPLDKNQCRTANWQQIGYQNGLKGREPARFEEERKACADHRIEADATAWKLGYIQGLGSYCTATRGYEIGRAGESYADVCPPESDAQFRPAFQDGQRIAKLAGALKDRQARLDDIRRALSDDDRRGQLYLDQIREGHQPPPAPPQLLDPPTRRQLEREHRQLRDEVDALHDELLGRDNELSARYRVTPLDENRQP